MSRNQLTKLLLAVVVIVSAKDFSFAVGSGGFENQVPHARAQGRANSVVASVDDSSAVTFNPARLTAINGGDLSVGFTYQAIETSYSDPSGANPSDSTDSDPGISPNFHIAHRFGMEKWGFGLGINVPHGLGNEWKKTGTMALLATESALALIDVNPAAAYKINDMFSVGAGLDFYAADAELKSFDATDALGSGGGTNSEIVTEADGSGLGANIGVSAVLNEKHSLGVSYRTGANFDIEGTQKVSGDTASGSSNVKAELNIPEILMLGYAFKPNEKLVLECDLQWSGWGIVDNLEIKDKDTGTSTTFDRAWGDRWSIGLGTEYALKENLFLRGGYSFWSTPVPNETYEPSTPDADTHGLTLGIGTVFKSNVTLDFAAMFYRLNDRHINGSVGLIPTPSGDYETHAEYFALNVGYKFAGAAQ